MANDSAGLSKRRKKADQGDKKAPAPKKIRFFQRSAGFGSNGFRHTWDEAGKGSTEEEREAAASEAKRPARRPEATATNEKEAKN